LGPATGQRERIELRIEITLTHLDPPEGVAVLAGRRDDGSLAEPQGFVGWLGLFWVLHSLIGEPVDQRPP
jgi:hypothetical protein